MKRSFNYIALIAVLAVVLAACAPAAVPTPEVVEREVVVTQVVEVTSEVEVPVDVEVTVEVPVASDFVTLRLNWLPGGYHAWFFYGKEQGFWRNRNIEIDIREGNGSGNVVRTVANQSDTFAYITPDPGLVLISEDAPITFIYTTDGGNQGAVTCNAEAGVEVTKDLEGLTILSSPGSSMNVIWPAFVASAGLDESTINYTLVDPSAQISTVLAGQADCTIGGISDQAVTFEAQGLHVTSVLLQDYGLGAPGGALVAHSDTVANNPDLVARFVAGAEESQRECDLHPTECIDAMMLYYPQEDRAILEGQYEANKPWIFSPKNPDHVYGMFVEDDWNDLLRILTESGSIESDKPITDYYTTEFLP